MAQIFAHLDGCDGDNESLPPDYWDLLRESQHERIEVGHWHSAGQGDVYADAMINLQDELVQWTIDLYYSQTQGGANLQLRPTNDDGDDLPIFLHYDEKLLSRWRMLFYAMAGSGHWKSFEVKSLEMPQILLEEFARAMKQSENFFSADAAYSVSFDTNRFDQESVLYLSKVVDQCIYMSSFAVTNNAIDSLSTAAQLSTSFAKHNHLEKIDLSDSGLGESARVLSAVLSSCANLEKLCLNNVNMQARDTRSRGITIISDFVASNPLLQKLELDLNQLGDDAALLLAKALGTNTNLLDLSLADNNFSEVATDAFSKVIFDDDDLNTVIDSNHSCTIHGVSEKVTSLQCSKEKKKFRVIYSHGKTTPIPSFAGDQFFTDAPVELTPEVLSWIQSVQKMYPLPCLCCLRPFDHGVIYHCC